MNLNYLHDDGTSEFDLKYVKIYFYLCPPGIIADNFADEIILDPKEIAKRYLKTWFLLDLISSLPLDYVITLISPEENVPQLVHAGTVYSSIQAPAGNPSQ